MRHLRTLLLALLATALFLAPQTAFAGLDGILGDVRWGDSKEDVLNNMRRQRISQLNERSDLRNDRVALQRERQRVLDDIRRVEDSYMELRGGRTGYEVSVISGEFTPDTGESLMRMRDDVAQHFYFFNDGRLYKILIAYEQSYVSNISFDAFFGQVNQRYGRPSGTEYGTVRGEEVLVQATWSDGRTMLKIDDKREFFGTFTMAFSQQETEQRLSQNRPVIDWAERDSSVSSRVSSLMEMSAEDRNARVVDGLVGDVDVTLPERASNRPVEEEEEAEPERPAARPAQATPRRPAQRQTAPAASEDDLVIY